MLITINKIEDFIEENGKTISNIIIKESNNYPFIFEIKKKEKSWLNDLKKGVAIAREENKIRNRVKNSCIDVVDNFFIQNKNLTFSEDLLEYLDRRLSLISRNVELIKRMTLREKIANLISIHVFDNLLSKNITIIDTYLFLTK